MTVAVLALAGLLAQVTAAPPVRAYELNREAIERHLRFLCDPVLEGRLTLSPGERIAAEYIASEFRAAGLLEGPNVGYIHEFDVTVNVRPTVAQALTMRHEDGRTTELSPGVDFAPLNGTATVEGLSGRLVFVGHGIVTDERDDYAGVDVTGKVVLMLRGQPEGHARVTARQKAIAAREKGAVGIVKIGPQVGGGSELPRPSRPSGIPADLGLAAVGVSARLSETVTGVAFTELSGVGMSPARELPVTVSLTTGTEPNQGRGRNVVGYLPGKDPVLKDEFVVIGAHFDHLGWGEVGSRTGRELPHVGADDNASGTVGVIELARYFASRGDNRRTLIFQAYSGEEVGLVGSTAWVRENAEKVSRMSAMLNMDMIGRVRNESIGAMGVSSSADWAEVFAGVEVPGLALSLSPGISPSSDHAPFARAQVPVVFFHSGLTDEYHTERDTVETLNLDGMLDVVRAVALAVERVDRRDARLAWNPEARVGQRQGRNVQIGLVPDMSDSSGPGMRLQGVVPDSPAAKAGLQAGDRILQIGDREVKDMESLQAAFGSLRAGQPTAVVVQRGAERLTLTVTPSPS